jgi:hypothetical protein
LYLLRESFQLMNYLLPGSCIILMLVSCQYRHEATTEDRAVVKDSVDRMMTRISADITKGGPRQWLTYFEDDPGFFMASDGTLKFGDFASATTYTRDSLPQIISRITLNWDHLRIDPLNREYAYVGADFDEDITLTNGQKVSDVGFFTAVAHFDGGTWKLRNLNWASKPR